MRTFKILYDESDPVLALSAKLMGELASDIGATLEILPSDFAAVPSLAEVGEDADALRVTLQRSIDWLAGCPVQPVKVSHFGAADTFLKTARGWTPELAIERALHRTIIREAHHVDIRESAYVIGNGPLLRVVAGVALGLGFRRVHLVGEDESDLLEQKELLRRVYIGAEVMTLPVHSLTLQTVGASLLMNVLPLGDRPDLAADLAYFNFMKKGGLVLDLHGFDEGEPVLEEARRAGLRVIPAHLVSAGCDLELLRSLKIDTSVFEGKYFSAWAARAGSPAV